MPTHPQPDLPLAITAKDIGSWPGYLEPHDLHAIAKRMWADIDEGRTFGKKSVLYPSPDELWTDQRYAALRSLLGERLAWKLSSLSAVGPDYAAVKIVGANALNRHLGLERSNSTIILFDKMSMRPVCLIAGTQISAARTGTYASIIAETFFAPNDRLKVFLFGAGPVARWICLHLAALKGAAIENVFVRTRSATSAQLFAQSLTHLPFIVTPVTDNSALADVDLVITASNAHSPVFASGELKRSAVVVHLGGDETPASCLELMRENGLLACDDIAMVSARKTSSLAQLCRARHGSVKTLAPHWGIKSLAGIIKGETKPFRPAHITCVGLPSLDLYVAQHVYQAFVARHGLKHALGSE